MLSVDRPILKVVELKFPVVDSECRPCCSPISVDRRLRKQCRFPEWRVYEIEDVPVKRKDVIGGYTYHSNIIVHVTASAYCIDEIRDTLTKCINGKEVR